MIKWKESCLFQREVPTAQSKRVLRIPGGRRPQTITGDLTVWPILHICMFLWLSSNYTVCGYLRYQSSSVSQDLGHFTYIKALHCSYVVLKSCHLTSLRRTGPLGQLASIGSSLTFAILSHSTLDWRGIVGMAICSDQDQLLQSSEGVLLNVFFVGLWWFAVWVCNFS